MKIILNEKPLTGAPPMTTNQLPDDATLREWMEKEAKATKAPWESYRWMLSAKTGPHKYELMGWTANNKATRTQQSQLNCDLLALARNHFRPLIEEVIRLRERVRELEEKLKPATFHDVEEFYKD